MGKILHDYESKVFYLLCKYPETRNRDVFLYTRYLEEYCGTEYLYQPFVITLQDTSLPNFESLGRVRRKIQANHPELQSSIKCLIRKAEKEEEFRDYARE